MRRSEFDFIRLVRRRAESCRVVGGGLVRGIGDDAAVVRTRRAAFDTLMTADLLVEDVDFRRSNMPPRLLGHKALAVSLSDIAAMGGRPRWALLSVGVPREVWRSSFLEQFYEGFYALAAEHKVTLVGGDVSRTPGRVVVDSIVVGEAARGRAVLRSGARVGDRIFVTGTLGGASAGLRLLEGGARLKKSLALAAAVASPMMASAPTVGDAFDVEDASTAHRDASTPPAHARRREARERLMLRHLRPVPRVGWGRLLGEKRLATSMIDLSDGLSSDLAHLCHESGVGARIDAARIPLDPLIEQARVLDADDDPLSMALDGGEDFELLFTVSPRRAARLPEEIGGVRVSEIGVVTSDAGRVLLLEGKRTRTLRPEGFTHFK